jgi:predicted small lipoprotein YifL
LPFLRLTLRPAFALLAIVLATGALSGCGRRGPLELPPDVQARGAQLQAEADAERAQNGRVSVLGEPENAPPVRIPGTIGNRPPPAYPFLLDPLL